MQLGKKNNNGTKKTLQLNFSTNSFLACPKLLTVLKKTMVALLNEFPIWHISLIASLYLIIVKFAAVLYC